MSLQDKLDAFKADFETNVAPPAAVAVMHGATADLIATGQAERALKAGDRAPDFTLSDADGAPVSLAGLLAKGPVVLTFYRGVWCPYCNIDLKAVEEVAGQVRALGATLVALSPQTPVNSRKSQRQNGLSFPILSDAGLKVAEQFGIKFAMPAELIELYKAFGNDFAVINGDDSWTLPMPGRFVIDRDGVIAYAEVSPDYTRRPDPAELLPVLARLRETAAA